MPRESTTGTIYAGAFHRAMDAKNRATIPSEWLGQADTAGIFYLVPGKVALSVMPESELSRKEDDLRARVSDEVVFQEALRQFYGRVRRIEPDKQGRILLPEDFCRQFELSGEVVFVGVKSRFEIWNPAKWSSAGNEAPRALEEARRALEAMGL